MHYADSSFIVSLVVHDDLSEAVRSSYQRLGRPPLAFCPLHQMEVPNAMRLLYYLLALKLPVAKRVQCEASLHTAELRLALMRRKRALVECDADWKKVIEGFEALSSKHTFKIGARSFDTLHVAWALELGLKDFVTCDKRQADLARAAGLRTTLVTL